MIFVGYESDSKGYQFWDAAHQHIELSRDVKFNETLFPAQEAKKTGHQRMTRQFQSLTMIQTNWDWN